jgi:hypothetical protein
VESQTGRILKTSPQPDEGDGVSTTFRFTPEHVLYGKLRPYLNKVALPDFAGRCTTEMIPLRCGQQICREFLALILRRPETVEHAMQGKTGSRMPRADMDQLLQLEIPLPPLSEQRRIAGILREQMAAVERARAAARARLEAVKALPAAFLRQVFPQPAQPLPPGWRWVRLGEVADVVNGYSRFTRKFLQCQRRRITRSAKRTNRVRCNSPHSGAMDDESSQVCSCEGDILFAFAAQQPAEKISLTEFTALDAGWPLFGEGPNCLTLGSFGTRWMLWRRCY